jgi:hypothetical protein
MAIRFYYIKRYIGGSLPYYMIAFLYMHLMDYNIVNITNLSAWQLANMIN